MSRAANKMLVESIFYNNPDTYPPIINSTRLLARAGSRVRITSRDDGRDWGVSYPAEARVRRVKPAGGGSWQRYLHFTLSALRHAGRGASLFVGHDMHGFLVARLLATLYRRPLVYHCHDFADPKLLTTAGLRVVHAFERRLARTAGLVIVPDAGRGEVIARALRLGRPPLVVANAPLSAPTGSGEALRRALAGEGYSFEETVLRQGRIGPGHAIEATLRSMPLWKCEGWGFAAMGQGEETYIRSLRGLAESLGVAGRFAVLPPVGYDRVAEFTPGAGVGHALYEPVHLNNAYMGTASNKLMEYVAAGVPVVVSGAASMRAFLDGCGCGVAADESSPESIAGALNRLLPDRERRAKMGLAGRRAFEEEYCYERQFEPALRAMKMLARRRPGR